MYRVDLNCDLGESFGNYRIGQDQKIIPLISSANVACGYHAGDPLVMNQTVALAKEAGISVGAHPGYPDLMGFGRREMNLSSQEIKAYLTYQIGALDAFCKVHGIRLNHVKPHGALYNQAATDSRIAKAICQAVAAYDDSLIVMGLSGSRLLEEAKALGLRSASEVFADRNYEPDGSLVSRSKDYAIIKDEDLAIERVIRMVKEGKVQAHNGEDIFIQADSICVHGDGQKALIFVERIGQALKKEEIAILPLGATM